MSDNDCIDKSVEIDDTLVSFIDLSPDFILIFTNFMVEGLNGVNR